MDLMNVSGSKGMSPWTPGSPTNQPTMNVSADLDTIDDFNFDDIQYFFDNVASNEMMSNTGLLNDDHASLSLSETLGPASSINERMPNIDLFNDARDDASFSLPETIDAASDNLTVKMQLQCRIKEKMKSEGKELTSADLSADSKYNQLTEEDEVKRNNKKERNKEAARRSRDKKKENIAKLSESHMLLMSENQDLKNAVAQLKIRNEVLGKFVANHKCSSVMMVPQQDHGDDHYQETGSKNNELACRDQMFIETNNSVSLESIFEELYGQAFQKPQEVHHILPEPFWLQRMQRDQSQLATSAASYETQGHVPPKGFGIGIQENTEPNNVSNYNDYLMREDSYENSGNNVNSFFPAEMPIVRNFGPQSNGSSFNLSARREPYINAWSTETTDNESESKEALNVVLETVQPPSEKKRKLE